MICGQDFRFILQQRFCRFRLRFFLGHIYICGNIFAISGQILGKLGVVYNSLRFVYLRSLRNGFFLHIGVNFICVLDNADTAGNDGLTHSIFRGVQLYFIKRSVAADFIDGIIQQIAGAGLNLPQRPAVAASIVAGGKLRIWAGGVGIHQFIVQIQAVNRTGQRGVALRRAGGRILLDRMDTELFQDIAEMHGGSCTAFHGKVLRSGGNIAVNRELGYQVDTGQEVSGNRAILAGGHIHLYAIAGDVEREAGHNAVLTGLDDLSLAVCLRLDFYRKGDWVAGTGQHGLIPGTAPDQHFICHGNVLAESKSDGIRDHISAGEGVAAAIAGHGNTTAGQQFQILVQAICIRHGHGVDLGGAVPFQFQRGCAALRSAGKGRDLAVLCDLLQNPVVGFFCRTPGNDLVILIRRYQVVIVEAVWIRAKLLLIFPENALGRHFPVVSVDPGDGQLRTGLPAIKSGQHETSLRAFGQQRQIVAVAAALGGIGVICRGVGHTALNTIDRVGHAAGIRQHVMVVGRSAASGHIAGGTVLVIDHVVPASLMVIGIAIGSTVGVAKPGACFRARGQRKGAGGQQSQEADHAEQKCRQPCKGSAGRCSRIHFKTSSLSCNG